MAVSADSSLSRFGTNADDLKTAAVIAEYNPFHKGHRLHLEKTREMGADRIIAVMSGSMVQRGSAAVFDKHFRAACAVANGADLVVELPYPFCCSCAEIFAKKAVEIINGMGIVDFLSFGSETDDIDLLMRCADICLELDSNETVKERMRCGDSYPSAVHNAVRQEYGEKAASVFSQPNSTLAAEYLKALKLSGSNVRPVCIKREGAAHDGQPSGETASASYIREQMLSGAFGKAQPYLPYSLEGGCGSSGLCDTERMSGAVIMRLSELLHTGQYQGVPDFTQSFADRISGVLKQREFYSFSELVGAVKSKSFTFAKAARTILYAYFGVNENDLKLKPYCRVLAFNQHGKELIRKIREAGKIEVSASLKDFSEQRLAFLDLSTARFQAFCGSGKPTSNELTRRFDGFIGRSV